MTAKKQASTFPIYQLKVTLKGLQPPIWRRIQVPGNISLCELDGILQRVMGWHNEHLSQFRMGDTYYGDPETDCPIPFTPPMRDAERFKLNQVALREKTRFEYEYDFGDSWKHDILVEKVRPPEPGAHYPVCLAGARACPPEDCGGVWGYADRLEIMNDPEDEEHDEIMERMGDRFDPEEFDLEAINKRLASL